MTAAERARASRVAQDLPERLDDPAVLAEVAQILASTVGKAGDHDRDDAA